MKLINLFSILFLIMVLNAQDDFFEPGYSIGGYGELHWNRELDKDGETTKNQMDFHRFIIYYGYSWTEEWSFKSELELEHNFVSSAYAHVKDLNTDADNDPTTNEEDTYVVNTSDYGELELEQAYVNYHTDNWGFQGGVILPTVGLINEYHEPPLFLSVERPLYNKYVIPTTWFGNGFAFYGKMNDFGWRVAIMEDLVAWGQEDDGSPKLNIANGIRDARGKGYKTTGWDLLKNISMNYSGISGLRLAGSMSMNNVPINVEGGKVTASLGVSLMEFNAKYNANNIYAVVEYGQISYDNSNYTDFAGGNTSGYYLDIGYNFGEMVNCGTLIPWFRMSNVIRDDKAVESSENSDTMRFGLTWWPIDNVAFKLDYAKITSEKATDNETSEFNLGIGYSF